MKRANGLRARSQLVLLCLAGCGSNRHPVGGDGGPSSQLADTQMPDSSSDWEGGISTGNGGADGGGRGDLCASADVKATRLPSTVWLIVDNSFDMGQPGSLDGDTRPPWGLIRDVLIGAQGVVPTLQGAVRFGLLLPGDGRPDQAAYSCERRMPRVDPALGNRDAIASVYPTEAGMYVAMPFYALDYVLSWWRALPMAERGPTAVVLARAPQGEHLCADDYLAQAQLGELLDNNTAVRLDDDRVEALVREGIQVYVFAGVPGASPGDGPADRVPALAALGGTGRGPIDFERADDLRRTLLEITGALIGCDVELRGKVTAGKECTGSVAVDGVDLPCNAADGWMLAGPSTIRIRGQACSKLKAQPTAAITARFPCDAVVLL